MRSVTEIWEGANTKHVDLDVKVGPYFTAKFQQNSETFVKVTFLLEKFSPRVYILSTFSKFGPPARARDKKFHFEILAPHPRVSLRAWMCYRCVVLLRVMPVTVYCRPVISVMILLSLCIVDQ